MHSDSEQVTVPLFTLLTVLISTVSSENSEIICDHSYFKKG